MLHTCSEKITYHFIEAPRYVGGPVVKIHHIIALHK